MVWLGRRLAEVFADLVGFEHDLVVHDGAMVSTAWSSTICFDGVGAGEVLVDGRKLVGISQRRMRHAARLQCCWYARYDPVELIELLHPSARPLASDLSPVATLPAHVSDAAVAALVDRALLTRSCGHASSDGVVCVRSLSAERDGGVSGLDLGYQGSMLGVCWGRDGCSMGADGEEMGGDG